MSNSHHHPTTFENDLRFRSTPSVRHDRVPALRPDALLDLGELLILHLGHLLHLERRARHDELLILLHVRDHLLEASWILEGRDRLGHEGVCGALSL